MKNVFAVLILAICVCSIPCYADIIIMSNGDKLVGNVHIKHFKLQAPYGTISLRKALISMITLDHNQTDQVSIQSINNDLFSGRLLNDNISLHMNTTGPLSLDKEKVAQIVIGYYNTQSYQAVTALFFMKNKDKFSGKLLNRRLNIDTGYTNTWVKREDINRIEFSGSDQATVSINLKNGSRIHGELLDEKILIDPHLLPELAIDQDKFRTIQFNVNNLFLK